MTFEEEFPEIKDLLIPSYYGTRKLSEHKYIITLIEKNCLSKQRIREVLKKCLTAEYEGAVIVQPEFYKIIEELGL